LEVAVLAVPPMVLALVLVVIVLVLLKVRVDRAQLQKVH